MDNGNYSLYLGAEVNGYPAIYARYNNANHWSIYTNSAEELSLKVYFTPGNAIFRINKSDNGWVVFWNSSTGAMTTISDEKCKKNIK